MKRTFKALILAITFFAISCSQSIAKYKLEKTRGDVYKNRQELYQKNY